MSNKIKNICVFASSSNNIDKQFFLDAEQLGKKIAQNNYNIVYGGSELGLMGAVTKSASELGSKIIGVMPQKLYDLGIHPGKCDELIITKGMRERKGKMDELSQATIALAGGFGTLEEISEMLTQKQLGYSNKPIVFFNSCGIFDDLINFFDKLITKNFAQEETKKIFHVANTADEVIDYINNYAFEEINYIDKKIILKNQSNV